ncbi:procollagen C-endopeptidase enhancer 2b isoform X2 [Heterodontus francisci]|uniref:procollagen C-endopeptidase enhancer 2b isoform X2 n=1 Tax=Heterodontus francisci TaxID=7792 RepID=UPI00355BAA7B
MTMKSTAYSYLGLLCATLISCQLPAGKRNFKCGGIRSGESGFIGSEGFPGLYPPNSKCTWKITVPKGRVVALNFRFLDLERDTLCRYDYIDVYNGHVNAQRLGRFCGTSKPGAIISTGNKMMVQMVTDANTAGNGFVAMYSATRPNQRNDQFCGGRLEKSPGSFKTPNWPDHDYPAGVSCSWHIVAPKHQIIELKFEKFDVERDNYCRYDYVSVFNGGENNEAKRIGKYCGDSPPAPVLSQENEIVVQFLSDLSLTADGFLAHFKFRSKKFLSTTTAPITAPTTTMLTGTVITAVTRNGSIHTTISIINIYKEGTVAIQQAGKNMSVRIISVCKKCPIIKRGLNYIFMGQVDEAGRGRVLPNSFVVPYRSKNQRFLNNLKNRRC